MGDRLDEAKAEVRATRRALLMASFQTVAALGFVAAGICIWLEHGAATFEGFVLVALGTLVGKP